MADKKIGLLTACSLVVANMVGTGVFSSLGFQVGPLPSTLVLLILWLCGGLIALCGALSYVELAKVLPGSGGEYHYINTSYPKVISYFAGLVSLGAGFAAPVALAAITFAKYLARFMPHLHQHWTAFLLISYITFFHCFSLRLGSIFQLITTAVKIILIVVFIVFGLQNAGSANPIQWQMNELQLLGSRGFAVALVYVSFAYSGWNACVYIFAEINNPTRNIKKAMVYGTAFVTIIYILLNFVFLKTVPLNALDGVIEIGSVAAQVVFGTNGGKWMSGLIALLLISSISAMVWVGPRVIASMLKWEDKAGKSTPKPRVPLRAMAAQYLITVLLLITGSYEFILVTAGVLLSICSCLSVIVLFFPANRPPWKKLIAPVLFLAINGYTMLILLT